MREIIDKGLNSMGFQEPDKENDTTQKKESSEEDFFSILRKQKIPLEIMQKYSNLVDEILAKLESGEITEEEKNIEAERLKKEMTADLKLANSNS